MSTPLRLPLSIGHWGADDDEQENTDRLPAVEATPPAEDENPGGKLVMLQGGQMGAGDQAREAVAHAYRVALLRFREARKREGGLIHGLMIARPPSVQEQCDYAASRAWVPPGHDGGIAEMAGAVYHLLIGRPGVAFFNLGSAIFSRPLRLLLTLLILSMLSICLFAFVL
jgi:hypothetical protein